MNRVARDYFSKLNPRDIWCVRQNKPTLIAQDLQEYGVPQEISYSILLGRGVFKWLAVHRELIRLKIDWKQRITETINQIKRAKVAKDEKELVFQRGRLKTLEEVRAEIRALCKSERFGAPDFDRGAQHFLSELREDNNGGQRSLREQAKPFWARASRKTENGC